MKNRKRFSALFAVCLAAVMAAAAAGCSFNITVNENSKNSSAVSSEPAVSSEDESSKGSETGGTSTSEVSQEPVSEAAESTEERSQSSKDEKEESFMTESEAAEVSIDGYQFDDEQIVSDYHTAEEFTKNDEFNSIFKNNILDTEYTENLRDAMTLKEMREVTIECAKQWEKEVGMVYDVLCDMLKDKPEELKKLEASQDEWKISVTIAESSFNEEAASSGTEAMLSADTAMMNYYKGRAAVLLEQIYELNGNQIQLVEYGL